MDLITISSAPSGFTLISTNRINSKILMRATTTLTGMGFSYSVFTLGVPLAEVGAFLVGGFLGFDFEVELLAEVFFLASVTIFSAWLAVFFLAIISLLML